MAQTGDVIVGNGAVTFGLEYRDEMSDQGLCIHALGEVDGCDVELLRFDCFDHQPHYHYGPENKNERLMLDRTTEGDGLDWALTQISTKLPDMVRRAGYEELADGVERWLAERGDQVVDVDQLLAILLVRRDPAVLDRAIQRRPRCEPALRRLCYRDPGHQPILILYAI